jgi:hypothetical protein
MCATDRVYECSDGNYYGNADIWARFEAGEWTPVSWEEDSGTEWVETADGELLTLQPVPESDLPPHVDIEPAAGGVTVEIEAD